MLAFRQLLAIFVLQVLLSSYLYARDVRDISVSQQFCPQSSDVMVLLVEDSIYESLMLEINSYIVDVCRFQNYSIFLHVASSKNLNYINEIYELMDLVPNVRGVFFVGNFLGEKTSLIHYSKENASWKGRLKYNVFKGIIGINYLDDSVVRSHLSLEFPKQAKYDHAGRVILSGAPKKLNIEESLFTAKLPLGGVENISFYKNYFRKIAKYRRENKTQIASDIFLFRDGDRSAVNVSENLFHFLNESHSWTPDVIEHDSLIDSGGVFQQTVTDKLSTPHLASFFFFHGSGGRFIVNEFNPFQSVIDLDKLESNSRISISLACSISEDETNERGFVFRSLTSGRTINVIAGTGMTLMNNTLLSKKFMSKFFTQGELLGSSFRYFVDHREGVGIYPISFSWNKSVFQLYGDPLLPL